MAHLRVWVRSPGFSVTTILGVTALVVWLCVRTVALEPTVSPYFFFSTEDPQLQIEQEIAATFAVPAQLILSVEGPVNTPAYAGRIAALTERLGRVPGVASVLSLSRGPRSLRDAQESPLWRRVLIAESGRASHLILFVRLHGTDPLTAQPAERLIAQIEQVVRAHQREDFRIAMSGVPYIVELMRRYLLRDLQVFSLATAAVFGLLTLAMIRHLVLAGGMLVVCLNAGLLTLLLNQLLGVRVGLLTANLATLVVTMTLSHLVFLTFNWRYLWSSNPVAPDPVTAAVRMTLTPSFWSMFTTLLGFGSLLFVQAEPLRRLGRAGSIGALVAFGAAYLLYPWILRISRPRPPSPVNPADGNGDAWDLRGLLSRPHRGLALALIAVTVLVATGIWRLRNDPNLLSYFAKGSALRVGLEYVDRNLGSSPLILVVRDPQGARFVSTGMYRRLWELQQALEQEPAVGSVVSLPVLMAEARRLPLVGAILPLGWLLKLMETPAANQLGKLFVTEDRTSGLFLLFMREGGRETPRLQMVTRLRELVQAHEFEPHLIGGLYVLQGKLSQLVVSSLVWGLVMLAALFAGIVWSLSRSWRITLAVTVSMSLIPAWLLGVIGHLQVPFDVISAPAANLALSMGIDAMIHLLMAVRRFSREGAGGGWQAWADALRQQRQSILFSTVVVCAGFSVFGLSMFPPSRRFGLSIVLGTLIVPIASLLVLPGLAGPRRGARRPYGEEAMERLEGKRVRSDGLIHRLHRHGPIEGV